MSRRIGVYGGSFNPIHNGHIHILRQFIAQLGLDQVLVIPDRTPPHKPAPDLAPGEDRFHMCRLATADIPGVMVSDMELNRTGKSYTADTLLELKKQYPADRLILLMGEDMFCTVDHWYHPEVLFSCAALAAAPREESMSEEMQNQLYSLQQRGVESYICPIPFLPVSSTQIRDLCREGADISGLVPLAVEAYMREKHLYGL